MGPNRLSVAPVSGPRVWLGSRGGPFVPAPAPPCAVRRQRCAATCSTCSTFQIALGMCSLSAETSGSSFAAGDSRALVVRQGV